MKDQQRRSTRKGSSKKASQGKHAGGPKDRDSWPSETSVLALAALLVGIVSLGVSIWSAAKSLEYARLTSTSDIDAYLVRVSPQPRVDPPNPNLVYCEANVRLVNAGGAGAILEQIDVTASIGGIEATQSIRAIQEYTDATESYIGDTLYTAYTLGSTFPVLVPPYDVAEIIDVTAELENYELEFSHDVTRRGYDFRENRTEEVLVSYDLTFAGGALVEIPPERCTLARAAGQ